MTELSHFRYYGFSSTWKPRFVINFRLHLVCPLILLLMSACADKQLQSYIEDYAKYEESIFVIDHGMHTALVVEVADLLDKLGLQNSFYSEFRYFEIGRGDADFYRQAEAEISTSLAALFFATPAIIHLNAYNLPPSDRYLQS
jgi:hypothetical protein